MRFGAGETFWDRIEQNLARSLVSLRLWGPWLLGPAAIRALPQDAAEASHFGDARAAGRH